MKKFTALFLTLICIFCFSSCDSKASSKKQLLKEGTIKNVAVSSLPEKYSNSFYENDAKKIADYIFALTLEEDFKENPDEYNGMTWVMEFEYENGEKIKLYHFGNMFIRAEGGPWYKMSYEQASKFSGLLNELESK